MSLTKEARDALPDEMFAVPGKRKLPIHDPDHVKMAWDMVDKTQGLTPGERSAARQHILRRAKELGVDTTKWDKTSVHALAFHLDAMAIEIPEVIGHPNRAPFKGVLTFVDKPSDEPPGGASGKRVQIPADVAKEALASLLGMAVDCSADFDEHNPQHKIGLILEADVVGNELRIEGFIYAKDFPELWKAIQAEKHLLGFSYEADVRIRDLSADIWVVEHCVFTGAAVLYKTKAAYHQTSLAAQAEGMLAMDPAELKKLIGEAVNAAIAPVSASVESLRTEVATVKASADKTQKSIESAAALHAKVQPHAEKLRSCAAEMEAAGIGTHPRQGHVAVLRHMADRMEAEAMMGHLPTIHRDHDYLNAGADQGGSRTQEQQQQQGTHVTLDPETKKTLETLSASVASIGTEVKDLKEKGFQAAAAPARRTIPAEVKAFLDKHSLAAAAQEGKLTVEQVDKALEGLPRTERLAQKLRLQAAGVIGAPAAAAA